MRYMFMLLVIIRSSYKKEFGYPCRRYGLNTTSMIIYNVTARTSSQVCDLDLGVGSYVLCATHFLTIGNTYNHVKL